jgi:hypothetical protein
MIELQDDAGRLVVILPMKDRHCPKMYYVYIDGRSVAEFRTCREAMAYVDTLVPGGLTTAKFCRV